MTNEDLIKDLKKWQKEIRDSIPYSNLFLYEVDGVDSYVKTLGQVAIPTFTPEETTSVKDQLLRRSPFNGPFRLGHTPYETLDFSMGFCNWNFNIVTKSVIACQIGFPAFNNTRRLSFPFASIAYLTTMHEYGHFFHEREDDFYTLCWNRNRWRRMMLEHEIRAWMWVEENSIIKLDYFHKWHMASMLYTYVSSPTVYQEELSRDAKDFSHTLIEECQEPFEGYAGYR